MFGNFISESCTGTTGNLALTGASFNSIGFSAKFSDGDTVSYVVEDADGIKKCGGYGTYNSVGTITRIDSWTWDGTTYNDSPVGNLTLTGGLHTVRVSVLSNELLPLDLLERVDNQTLRVTTNVGGTGSLETLGVSLGGTGVTFNGTDITLYDSPNNMVKFKLNTGSIFLPSTGSFGFAASSTNPTSIDAGLTRSAIGVVKVTDGAAGYGSLDVDTIQSTGDLTLQSYAVNNLVLSGNNLTYKTNFRLYNNTTILDPTNHLQWATTAVTGAVDVGLERDSSGVLKVTDGSTGEGNLIANIITSATELGTNNYKGEFHFGVNGQNKMYCSTFNEFNLQIASAMLLSYRIGRFRVPSSTEFTWSSTGSASGTSDTALVRSSAGTVRVTDGDVTDGDIIFNNASVNGIWFDGTIAGTSSADTFIRDQGGSKIEIQADNGIDFNIGPARYVAIGNRQTGVEPLLLGFDGNFIGVIRAADHGGLSYESRIDDVNNLIAHKFENDVDIPVGSSFMSWRVDTNTTDIEIFKVDDEHKWYMKDGFLGFDIANPGWRSIDGTMSGFLFSPANAGRVVMNNTSVSLSSGVGLNWSSLGSFTGTVFPTVDVGLVRDSAGVLRLTDGGAGVGDLIAGNLQSNNGALFLTSSGISSTKLNTNGTAIEVYNGSTNYSTLAFDQIALGSGLDINWSSTGAASGSKDTGISRDSAGIVKVTDGSTGYGQLKSDNITIGSTTTTGNLFLGNDQSTYFGRSGNILDVYINSTYTQTHLSTGSIYGNDYTIQWRTAPLGGVGFNGSVAITHPSTGLLKLTSTQNSTGLGNLETGELKSYTSEIYNTEVGASSRELLKLSNNGGSYITMENRNDTNKAWYLTHEHATGHDFNITHDDTVGAALSLTKSGDLTILGSLGVGTPSPAYSCHVLAAGNIKNVLESSDNGAVQFRLKSNSTNRRLVGIDASDTIQSQVLLDDNIVQIAGLSSNTNLFAEFSETEIRLNRDVGIGIDTPIALLHVSTDSDYRAIFERHNAGSGGLNFEIRKSRGTEASPTSIVAGDTLGTTTYYGYDGTSYDLVGESKVIAESIATGNISGKYYLNLNDTSGVLQTRLVINEDGYVGIGTDTPSDFFHILDPNTGTTLLINKTGAFGKITEWQDNGTELGSISKTGRLTLNNELFINNSPSVGELNLTFQGASGAFKLINDIGTVFEVLDTGVNANLKATFAGGSVNTTFCMGDITTPVGTYATAVSATNGTTLSETQTEVDKIRSALIAMGIIK